MTQTSPVVTVKWKSSNSAGGALSFDGSNDLKAVAQIDPTAALACFTPLVLEGEVYAQPLDNLVDIKKGFLHHLSAGQHDVPLSNITAYESGMNLTHASLSDLNRLLICEFKKQGESWGLQANGDLITHYKGVVLTMRLGKTRFFSKYGKDNTKLASLYTNYPTQLMLEHKKWKTIYDLYLSMQTRVCEENFV